MFRSFSTCAAGKSKDFGWFVIAAAATYVLAEAVAPNLRAGLREIKQLWSTGGARSAESDQTPAGDDEEARESRRAFLAHYAEATALLAARLPDAFFVSVPSLASDEVPYFEPLAFKSALLPLLKMISK
jgi:hypothetical protein